jgi:amidase
MREFLTIYDALLLPISPLPAFDADIQFPDTVAGEIQPDYLGWMRSVCAVTATGHPAIALPAGFCAAGTPVGVQLVGRHRAESELLALAAGFEAVTGFGKRIPTAI